jgi:hypothetical protein
MSDKVKTVLAVGFFVASLIFPLIGLLYGWWKSDAVTGLIFMTITFMVLSITGGFLLISVKDLSWTTVYLPYIFGAVYGFMPDAIPFSVDDAAATTAGAIFSFALSMKKESKTPRWIFIPLLIAGIYTLLGGFIPGFLDEFIVDLLALILAWVGTRQKNRNTSEK